MTAHVFTYGSLMFDDVWRRVVTRRYRSMTALLDGYERFEVRDETYPGLVAMAGARVSGVIYLDVDPSDLERLDLFEGDDYVRTCVPVACSDGMPRSAETYLYRLPDRLLSTTWAPERFAKQRFLETYCRVPRAS